MTEVWPLAQLQRRGGREFKRRCQAGKRIGGGDGTEKFSTAFSEAGVERMGGFPSERRKKAKVRSVFQPKKDCKTLSTLCVFSFFGE